MNDTSRRITSSWYAPRMRQVRQRILYTVKFQCRPMLMLPMLSALLLSSFSACADAPPTAAVTTVQPSEVLYALAVSPHGVTMAQGATQPLTIVARNILGDTVPGFDPATVQFVSEDSTLVTVREGVLMAHEVTPVDSFSGPIPRLVPTRVIASWEHEGISKADTFYVAVTPTARPVAALSLQPAPYPLDSTWLAGLSGGEKWVPVTALTAQHDTISGIYAFLSTGQRREHLEEYVDPRTAIVSFAGTLPGKHVWIYAEANVYGVTLRDSIEYVATAPSLSIVVLKPDAQQRPQVFVVDTPMPADYEFWVASCALVGFINQTTDSVAIVFDDSAVTEGCPNAGETGNIALLEPGRLIFRYIRPVGAHHWTVTRPNGVGFIPTVTGTIRVRSHTEF